MKTIALLIVTLTLVACKDDRPTYDQLKAENEHLASQLAATDEKIQDAKSDLDNLRTEIKDLEDEPCHEDAADDLDSKADDVESTMDEAEQESQ